MHLEGLSSGLPPPWFLFLVLISFLQHSHTHTRTRTRTHTPLHAYAYAFPAPALLLQDLLAPAAAMAAKTAAQEEFDEILAKSTAELRLGGHRDDARDYAHDRDHSDREEEETYRAGKVDENMKTAVYNGGGALRLPDPKFDSGRTTGVKGVIADARSYQEARKQNSNGWRSKLARGGSINRKRASAAAFLRDGTGSGSGSEDEEFLEQWREQRRLEMQREGNDIRKRRTSPSFRKYGRFDEVDALGYLDAIEKVGRDTVVVVFVYDADVCSCIPLLANTLTDEHSARFPKSSVMRCFPSWLRTRRCTSCASTTRRSSSTTRACRPFWRTRIRATCSPISRTSSIRFRTTRCSIPTPCRLSCGSIRSWLDLHLRPTCYCSTRLARWGDWESV